MMISGLQAHDDRLVVTWSDQTTTTFPTIWLRDNCPSGFHPQTHERQLDLLELDPAPMLQSAELAGAIVVLGYGDGHVSRLPAAMLAAHRPGQPEADPAAVSPEFWHASLTPGGIPRFSAAQILADDAALAAWMRQTARFGLSIVEGLPDRIDAGVEIAERIGFLRQTNFGTTFEVISLPDPNNLAYTSVALPLHTDLPNQEVPPGFQFLHCLVNSATGGGSVFADGFAIASDLRTEDTGAFRLLCETAIPFRFHDREVDIRVRAPVISLDDQGAFCQIRYNAHIAATFDMPAEAMPAYYRAYRAYMAKTREAKYRLTFKLEAGEMIAFDNRRVLHGREAFDPSSGHRHLHGCYVDRGEFLSRLRVLARSGQTST